MACAVRDELRSYLRGLMLVCLCVGALSGIAFALIGVQGAPALGLLVGLANCIPYFGPFIGGVPAVICALTGGLMQAGLALGAIVLVQQIDNMLITGRNGERTHRRQCLWLGRHAARHPCGVRRALRLPRFHCRKAAWDAVNTLSASKTRNILRILSKISCHKQAKGV